MYCGKSAPKQIDAAALAHKAVVPRGATATPIATVVANSDPNLAKRSIWT
jgi:hypothetical protein